MRSFDLPSSSSSSAARPQDPVPLPLPLTRSDLPPSLSSAEYARLYSQIFGDIVRSLNLDVNRNPAAQESAFVRSQLSNAGLPSFYRDVAALVEEESTLSGRQTGSSSQASANTPPADQMKDLALENNAEQARKILRDSLPPRNSAQRMLDMFFDYQNSVFYVCNRGEAQVQLGLMYDHPDQVTVSWLCQMFLIFSVAIQFDEFGDADGVAYHELGVKYMDDAVEENPQNTLWVMRAMLLLCFYQSPSKWNSVWIYLDAAIRGAQRFGLDLGQNQLKELSDEEYQEWRQIWLTIISLDRWVAIFLGRLPRIKESISQDPVFKGPFEFSSEQHVLQNSVTSLSIISGNILRDMYFTEDFRLNVCRQYKSELSTWLARLPEPLRQPVDSGVILNVAIEQSETIFNLHFMLIGAWMLLTRPLLLKAVKTRMSPVGFTGPIVSAVTADAAVCIDYAFKLITSATTMLCVSLPPKRSFMPIIFLINAANIMILGAVWKRRQGGKNGFIPTGYDQSREISALDAATRVLDFCGQRNTFARKYSILIKDLRQQLVDGAQTPYGDDPSPSPATSSRAGSMSSGLPYRRAMVASTELASIADSSAETPAFSRAGSTIDQSSTATSPLMNSQLNQGYYGSIASLNASMEPWSEEFGLFYPPSDLTSQSNDTTLLLHQCNPPSFLNTFQKLTF
ncbi:hypothetical protein B7463_g3382, partial [Scytalidium lignicola]